MALQEADRLVIFGITGDPAKKMTLPSLYRLERRGMPECAGRYRGFGANWTLNS